MAEREPAPWEDDSDAGYEDSPFGDQLVTTAPAAEHDGEELEAETPDPAPRAATVHKLHPDPGPSEGDFDHSPAWSAPRDDRAGRGGADKDEPPAQDVEAELMVLGAMLLDDEMAERLSQAVAPGDFYLGPHRVCFQVCCELLAEKGTIDVGLLRDGLERGPGWPGARAAGFISRIMNAVPSAANAPHYARMIRERAIERDACFWARDLRQARTERARDRARAELARALERWGELDVADDQETQEDGDLASFLTASEDPVAEFVPGVFVRKSLNIVFGPPGSGKSWSLMGIGVDLALPAWCEAEFLGRLIHRSSRDRCLWVYGDEDPARRVRYRARKVWRHGLGVFGPDGERLEQPHEPNEGSFVIAHTQHGLNTRKGQAWLERRVRQTGATMVVVDTISSATDGLKVNENDDVVPFMRFFQRLRDDHELTIFLVHHTRKKAQDRRGRPVEGGYADSMLGASQWRGQADGVLMLDCEEGDTSEVVFRLLKTKDLEEEMLPTLAGLVKESGRFELLTQEEADHLADTREHRRQGDVRRVTGGRAPRRSGETPLTPTRVFEAMRTIVGDDLGWFGRDELRRALGCTISTLRRALADGLIESMEGAVEQRQDGPGRPHLMRVRPAGTADENGAENVGETRPEDLPW